MYMAVENVMGGICIYLNAVFFQKQINKMLSLKKLICTHSTLSLVSNKIRLV